MPKARRSSRSSHCSRYRRLPFALVLAAQLCVQFGVPLAPAVAFLSCAILASCNFNIDDNPVDPNTGPADRWETKRFTVAGESGVYLSRTYKNDEFQYYEELYADPDTTTMPVIEQVKRFSALGELRYIERYSISDDGTVLRVFRYTAEGELLYSKAYVYDKSGDSQAGSLVLFGETVLLERACIQMGKDDSAVSCRCSFICLGHFYSNPNPP